MSGHLWAVASFQDLMLASGWESGQRLRARDRRAPSSPGALQGGSSSAEGRASCPQHPLPRLLTRPRAPRLSGGPVCQCGWKGGQHGGAWHGLRGRGQRGGAPLTRPGAAGLMPRADLTSVTAAPRLAVGCCCLIRFCCASPAEPHARPALTDVSGHGSWAPGAAGSRGACSGTRQ